MSKPGNGGRKRKQNSGVLAEETPPVEATLDMAGDGLDGTDQAEPLGVGSSEADTKKPLRTFRRAWKYKVPDSVLDEKADADGMCVCSYVSGRTQLPCKNIRPVSAVDSNGFCEVHGRFFRQLRQLYAAEQSRSDPGLFVASSIDEDGSLLVSGDDETLATSLEWPPSCEDLCGNFIENDECHPLQYAGTLVDEEILLIKLAMLERKKLAVQKYRELLIEKAKRKAAFYKKKVAEETKKGGLIATTRKEEAIMQAHRAAKTYRHWMRSSASEYLKKRNALKLEAGDDVEYKLGYLSLKNDGFGARRCIFVKKEEENAEQEGRGLQVEDPMLISLAPPQCSNRAVPKSLYCLEHITEDKEQKLFIICQNCNGIVQDFEMGFFFGCDKGEEAGKGNGFFSRICTCSPRTSNDSLSASSSESSIIEEEQANLAKAKASLGSRLSLQSIGEERLTPEKITSFGDMEKRGSFDEDDGLETPVKYVVIGSSDEETDELLKSPAAGDARDARPRIVPVIAPPFSTRNRHSNDSLTFSDATLRSVKVIDDRNLPVSPSPYLLKKSPRPKAKETFTCARARPFHPDFFDGKERKKRKQTLLPKPNDRYFVAEQQGSSQKPSEGSVSAIRPSSSAVQTLVHHIRNGGPKKVASGLHVPPASPAILPQRISAGPGRPSISANSNLQPPKLSRMTSNTPKSRRSPNFNMIMDPSTISLGPSTSRDASQHPSTSYGAHNQTAQRMDSPARNTVEVRRRPSTNSTFVRHVPLTKSDDARQYPYKSYNGTPRIVPNYRPRTSIIVNSSNPVTPSYRTVARDQYAERSVPDLQNGGEHYYRRVERQQYPATQNARSRLTLLEPAHQVYQRPSYSPYQGNSVTSRMREIPRPVELRRFQRYESYSDPFASDSRSRSAVVDPEAAAAVASIVADNSDHEDAEMSELIEKTDYEIDHSKPSRHLPEFSVKISSHEGEQVTGSSLRAQKSISQHPPIAQREEQNNIDRSCERKHESGEVRERTKSRVEDRQEDGLAVLALAAESHAAVRDHKTGSAADKSSVFPKMLTVPSDTGRKTPPSSAMKSTSVTESRTSTPQYQILGLEEEDDDDY